EYVAMHAAHGGDFGCRRCALVRYAQDRKHHKAIEDESEALAAAGAAPRWADEPLPAGLAPAAGGVLVLPDQAQMQPQAYVVHLAREATRAGVRIHERSSVADIDARKRQVKVGGASVAAQEIVMATHTPKG